MKKKLATLRSPKVLKRIIGAIIILLIVGGFIFLQFRTGRVFIDDSLVSAPISNIAPISPGKLQEMDIYEGEYISRGQPLAIVGGATLFADANGLVSMANNQLGSIVSTQNPVAQTIDLSN